MQLPPSNAERKLRELTQSANDADALMASTQGTLNALNTRLHDPQTPPEERVELEREISEVRIKRDRRARRRNNDRQMVLQCQRFLNTTPKGRELRDIPILDAKYNDVSDLKEGIEEMRVKIKALQNERRKINAAPLPLADLKEQARQYVDGLAEEGRPTMMGVHPVFPVPRAEYKNDQQTEQFLRTQAWLDKERLLGALVRELEDTATDGPDAMSEADKSARLAELEAELFELERDEEAFVCEALERGLDIERRVHADPRAVMSVEVVRRKRKAA